MTDTSNIKSPVTASFGSMAMTGLVSSTAGDQIGNSLADILSWLVQLTCKCVPPIAVTNALHTLTVAGVVGMAYYIHYCIAKSKQEVSQ